MKYSVTRISILIVGLVILSGMVGCRLNGPFYSPSAWQFYNPFKKSDRNRDLDENAFNEIEAEPISRPPRNIVDNSAAPSALESPTIMPPTDGYSTDSRNRAIARSTSKSNDTMNLESMDKKSIGTQENLYASRPEVSSIAPATQNPSQNPGAGTVSMTPSAIAQAPNTQTPNMIARTGTPDQSWSQAPTTFDPNTMNSGVPAQNYNSQGFATTTPQQQFTSPQQQQYGSAPVAPGYAATTTTAPTTYPQSPYYDPNALNYSPTAYPANSVPNNGMVSTVPTPTSVPAYPAVTDYPASSVTPQTFSPGTYPATGNYPNTTTTTIPAVNVPASSVPDSNVPATSYPTTVVPTTMYPETTPEMMQPAPPYNPGFNNFTPNTSDSYRPGTTF